MKTIITTGVAGFIGYHAAKKLLESGWEVIGIDNLNDYYDVSLKEARVQQLHMHEKFRFIKEDIANRDSMQRIFQSAPGVPVIHLAAQAGVRYSLENPYSYADSNLVGFVNILECCRQAKNSHLIYASSSSVYGSNNKVPFSVTDRTDTPINLYAATKRANELLAYSYSHLYGIPTTGLRFFTVYGPWGRPDMAYFSFTKNIIENHAINIYNEGNMSRDFTFVNDIVEGIVRLIDNKPSGGNNPPYMLYNIGNNHPVTLGRFIEILETHIGKKAIKKYLPLQPGDMVQTYADIEPLARAIGFRPSTSLEEGLKMFVLWYKEYFSKI